MATTWILYNKR